MKNFRARLARVSIATIGVMPLGVSQGIGSFLGRLSWLFKDRGARVTLDNLHFCFPELGKQERAALAKKSLRETYKVAGESFIVWQRGPEWALKRTLKIHNEEVLKSAVKHGRGVVVAVPHFGNWEFLGAHLDHYAPTTAMYQPPKKPWLEKLVKEKRESLKMRLVPTNARGVAAQLKALKEGGIVAILPDQVPAEESGIYSPFLGMQAYSMTLIHGFVQRTGCKVIMGAAKRVKEGFEVHYFEADPDIYAEDQQRSVDALNRSIASVIAIAREQYQWEYKRFKKQPNGINPYSA